MSYPEYGMLYGPAVFITYLDQSVPHPVRKVRAADELVIIIKDDGEVADVELADGLVTRVSSRDLSVLPYVSIGNEIKFTTPTVGYGSGTIDAQRRSGTIIAVLSGRKFGYVLVQGSEPYAYQVPIQDIIYGE